MDSRIALAVALGAYLLGAISFTRIALRILGSNSSTADAAVPIPVPGSEDTFHYTSVGATAIGMHHGGRVGCLVGILDMAKIALPVLALRVWQPDQPYFLLAAVFGMVGHIWPVYYRFRGGRGFSSIYGGFLAIDPLGAIVTSIGGLLGGIFVLRNFALAYFLGMWLMIPWLWFSTRQLPYLLYGLAVNVLYILGSIPELRQMRKLRKEAFSSLRASMEPWPMGKAILKMTDRAGIRIR